MIRLRLMGTQGDLMLAVFRLRQAFASVDASEPQPCRGQRGIYRIYVRAQL